MQDQQNDASSLAQRFLSSRSPADLASAALSNLLLFGLIFGLSATVNLKSLKKQLTNKFAIGCGVAMQFIIMPLMGFLAVFALRNYGLTEAMGLTLLVVTASPGGSYSNWWCSTFNAELALSVAMTTVSSLLSIGLLPANLFLYTYLAYGREGSIVQALDFKAIFATLGIVMGAILSGLYAGYRFDSKRFHVFMNRFGSVCGIFLILISVFLSSGVDGADSKWWNQPWAFYVAVAFPCLMGLSISNIVARSLRLSPPETVAISIECAYQNTGIATSVAITMFDDVNIRASAVAVPLFYGIVEAVAIAVYCVWAWKVGWTKAPPSENVCLVMSKTYEVSDSESENEEDDEPVDEGASDTSFFDRLEEGTADITEFTGATPPPQPASAKKKTRAPQIVDDGFWSKVFPPVLLRMLSGLSSSSQEEITPSTQTPKSKRVRLASDMTATTTQSGSTTDDARRRCLSDGSMASLRKTRSEAMDTPPTIMESHDVGEEVSSGDGGEELSEDALRDLEVSFEQTTETPRIPELAMEA